jgi:hypothetical protein
MLINIPAPWSIWECYFSYVQLKHPMNSHEPSHEITSLRSNGRRPRQWYHFLGSIAQLCLVVLGPDVSAMSTIYKYNIVCMIYLVSGFKHEFYFPFNIWDVILTPLTNSYFSRWLKTTNQLYNHPEVDRI